MCYERVQVCWQFARVWLWTRGRQSPRSYAIREWTATSSVSCSHYGTPGQDFYFWLLGSPNKIGTGLTELQENILLDWMHVFMLLMHFNDLLYGTSLLSSKMEQNELPAHEKFST